MANIQACEGMTFTKLDHGILQSSVMATDPVTFKVWIALLASADADGVARVAAPYLAAVCRLDLGTVRDALGTLCAPDPDSRTQDHNGCRVERCDGGWKVLNYLKYRLQGSTEVVREYERERKRRQRVVPDKSRNPSLSNYLSTVDRLVEGIEGGVGGENPRNGCHGDEAPVTGGNPLIAGRRPQMEREAYRVIREIGALEPKKDPTEILLEAARWEGKDGRSRSKVRVEAMTDDHLIRTVHDLKANLEMARKKHGAKGA